MKYLLSLGLSLGIATAPAQPLPQAAAASHTAAPPHADISNGVLHARIYLPDTANGYYRATRFDWSGVMPLLQYRGLNYCAQWFPTYAPAINDAVTGPVESFAPLGFQQAASGGSFVQIGVGSLLRPDPSSYSP
jgi:hypothetical protein